MRARIPLIVLALLIPGCAAPLGAGPSADEPGAAPDAPPGNRLLLDAPRPFTTTVSYASGGAEPMMLVDNQGRYLFIGDTNGLHRSEDGGATWRWMGDPFLLTADGWALAQSDDGTLHVANTGIPHIQYARSRDGGQTFEHVDLLVDVAPVADRPWIAARGNDEVAILFFDYGRSFNEACVGSRDGGNVWRERSLPALAPAKAGNAVFAPDGSLLYANPMGIHRFTRACSLLTMSVPLPPSGAQIFTQLALDNQTRPHVAQPSVGNGEMLLRGFPRITGGTLRELAVSPPELQSNTFGAISAHGGEIAVAWYGSETAGDPSSPTFDGSWNVFVARVTGFWTDAPQVRLDRITTEPNHVGDFCMSGASCGSGRDRDLLDYFGIDHDAAGNLHVAYGHDGAGSRNEVRYAFLPALS